MGTIGYSYGSEWHLLRYLGYHREDLNREVESAVGGAVIGWSPLGYETSPEQIARAPLSPVIDKRTGNQSRPPRKLDSELKGIRFLDPRTNPFSGSQGFKALDSERLTKALKAWAAYWPQRGNSPNWDAVGQIDVGGEVHWLLVEAKSHTGEVKSDCGAKNKNSVTRILRAFRATASDMGHDANTDINPWLKGYYQYANRLATLRFLIDQDIPTKLLFVYFLGDKFPVGRTVLCPSFESDWRPTLMTMEKHLGWVSDNKDNKLADHVHRLFLPVWRRSNY
jgi:hypothetical protein